MHAGGRNCVSRTPGVRGVFPRVAAWGSRRGGFPGPGSRDRDRPDRSSAVPKLSARRRARYRFAPSRAARPVRRRRPRPISRDHRRDFRCGTDSRSPRRQGTAGARRSTPSRGRRKRKRPLLTGVGAGAGLRPSLDRSLTNKARTFSLSGTPYCDQNETRGRRPRVRCVRSAVEVVRRPAAAAAGCVRRAAASPPTRRGPRHGRHARR